MPEKQISHSCRKMALITVHLNTIQHHIHRVRKKRGNSFFCITLKNVDKVSQFLARTILRTHFAKKIENLFQILSHHYAVMT